MFNYKLREQFLFVASDETIACILKELEDLGGNITAFEQTRAAGNRNFLNTVRLVAGSAEDKSCEDLWNLKKILKKFSVCYRQKTIIQFILTPGIPGQISAIYHLLWCRVCINSIYIGEDNTLYMAVSDIEKAHRILSNPNSKPCRKMD
ncbi:MULTISPECIES: hypothetical protein [Fictibacillus]|uniref:ACT domain-containing protein n=1 Tax=Fictibacillus terranigra TaxID=3058424 RepID=A0ABT8E1N9_9BACL|nr:hypothetical protein [Fictibacillus sp. CENA-BCM004]MDN4071829.1 hypothetical protein [Fictibacillus sp. CENA-BCM004]